MLPSWNIFVGDRAADDRNSHAEGHAGRQGRYVRPHVVERKKGSTWTRVAVCLCFVVDRWLKFGGGSYALAKFSEDGQQSGYTMRKKLGVDAVFVRSGMEGTERSSVELAVSAGNSSEPTQAEAFGLPVPSNTSSPTREQNCIVTGFSSNHFSEGICMLRTVPNSGSDRVMVMDMGLTIVERHALELMPNVSVHARPRMPPHASSFLRRSKAFKPFVIREAMRLAPECRWMFWADASIRFTKSVFHPRPPHGIRSFRIPFPQVAYTHPAMYAWFGRSRANCSLVQQQSGSMLFHSKSVVWQKVLNLWEKCCADLRCVMPEGASLRREKQIVDNIALWGHRDDQSAWTFALAEVLGDKFFLLPEGATYGKGAILFVPNQTMYFLEHVHGTSQVFYRYPKKDKRNDLQSFFVTRTRDCFRSR